MHIMLFMALGAIIGSFLNVVIYRLPLIMAGEKMSLSYPASGARFVVPKSVGTTICLC